MTDALLEDLQSAIVRRGPKAALLRLAFAIWRGAPKHGDPRVYFSLALSFVAEVLHATPDLLIARLICGTVSEAANECEQTGASRPFEGDLLILRYPFVDILLHLGQEVPIVGGTGRAPTF